MGERGTGRRVWKRRSRRSRGRLLGRNQWGARREGRKGHVGMAVRGDERCSSSRFDRSFQCPVHSGRKWYNLPRKKWSSTSHPALRLGRRPASSSSQSISKRAARRCALAAYHPFPPGLPTACLTAAARAVFWQRLFSHNSHGTHLLHTTPRYTPPHPAGTARTGAHTATTRRLPSVRRRPACSVTWSAPPPCPLRRLRRCAQSY